MPTAPATRRSARSNQTQAGTAEDSAGVPSDPSEASAVALDVGLGDSLGDPLGDPPGDPDDDADDDADGEAVGDSVSRSALPEAVGDAAPVGELDGLGGADVTAGDDAVVVGVGDSRSPSDRVGVGTLGVRVAVRVTEAVTLGVGRSPLPSPPHAGSRNKMHATAPTRTHAR
jgi:hypothetical protein